MASLLQSAWVGRAFGLVRCRKPTVAVDDHPIWCQEMLCIDSKAQRSAIVVKLATCYVATCTVHDQPQRARHHAEESIGY